MRGFGGLPILHSLRRRLHNTVGWGYRVLGQVSETVLPIETLPVANLKQTDATVARLVPEPGQKDLTIWDSYLDGIRLTANHWPGA